MRKKFILIFVLVMAIGIDVNDYLYATKADTVTESSTSSLFEANGKGQNTDHSNIEYKVGNQRAWCIEAGVTIKDEANYSMASYSLSSEYSYLMYQSRLMGGSWDNNYIQAAVWKLSGNTVTSGPKGGNLQTVQSLIDDAKNYIANQSEPLSAEIQVDGYNYNFTYDEGRNGYVSNHIWVHNGGNPYFVSNPGNAQILREDDGYKIFVPRDNVNYDMNFEIKVDGSGSKTIYDPATVWTATGSQTLITPNRHTAISQDDSETFYLNPVFGDGELYKEDEYGRPMEGFGFELKDLTNGQIYNGTTDSSGILRFPGLKYGWYEFKETFVPDDEVKINPDVKGIKIDSDNEVEKVTYTDYYKRGNLHVKKLDEYGKPVPGVKFHVTGGPTDDNMGQVDEYIVSGDDGIARLDNIRKGHYTVTEVEVSQNLVFAENVVQETDVMYDQTTTIQYKSKYQRGKSTLIKIDTEGDKNEYMTLAGTVYNLYAAEDIFEGSTQIYQQDDLIEAGIVTDEEGKTKIIEDLPIGKYYYIETMPSKGYEKNTERFDVEIKPGENGAAITTDSVTNAIGKRIKVTFKLCSNEDINLKDRIFSLTLIEKDGELSTNPKFKYTTTLSDEKCITFEDVPYGKYRVHEESVKDGLIPIADFDVDYTGDDVTNGKVYEYNIEKPLIFAYYLENTNNEEYTMIGTQHMYSVDTINNVNNIPNIEDNFDEYFSKCINIDKNEYFELNKEKTKNELNKELNELEDDKVFNIYFDRKTYKLKFNAGKKDESGEKNQIAVLNSDDNLVWTETEYMPALKVNNDEGKEEYETSAKYGEYVKDKYPYVEHENEYTFIGWMTDEESKYEENHKTKYMIDEYKILDENLILDANNTEKVHELYAVWTDTPKYYRYHYMEENLDTDSDEPFIEGQNVKLHNNKYYTELTTKDVILNKTTSVNLNTHDDLLGYNKIAEEVDIRKGDTEQGNNEFDPINVYIYYDRKEYTLVIHNMNDEYIPTEISSEYKNKGIYLDNENKRIKIKYGTKLSVLDDLKEKWIKETDNQFKYPYESKEIYMFDNWYSSPDIKEKINYEKFNFVNYENGMINIYANWKVKEDAK